MLGGLGPMRLIFLTLVLVSLDRRRLLGRSLSNPPSAFGVIGLRFLFRTRIWDVTDLDVLLFTAFLLRSALHS